MTLTLNPELKVARRIVQKAIAKGYLVSVNDGGEWVISRSTDLAGIVSALASTDEDTLVIRRVDGVRIGFISLVWGNAPDGSELPSDYTDNPEIAALVA